MAVLFIIMAVGFIVAKAGVLTPDGNKTLTRIVLFIALPCTILNSVFENDMDITIGDTLYFLLMSLLTFAIAFAIVLPIVYLLRGEKNDRGIISFLSVFSNCGFMGFPVVIAIFGLSSAFYVALFNIPFNILVFSLGIYMVSSKKNKDSSQTELDEGFNIKKLVNPTLIAALLAVPLAFADFNPPHIISSVLRITGSITTPGGMLVIGSTLAYVPLKTLFKEWRIVPVTLLKLIVIPLITWLILKQFITDDLLLGILVVISGMPSAAMASMFAIEYNGNERIASAGVFLTTLLCGITIPLIVHFLLT